MKCAEKMVSLLALKASGQNVGAGEKVGRLMR